MNNPERLHNQGSQEQVITPELKLSMELRDKCEQLLEEKGKAEIDHGKLALLVIPTLLPIGIIRMIRDGIKERGVPSLRQRRAILVGKSNTPEVGILSNGTPNPSKARMITVHIPMLDNSPADCNILELERGQGGKITTVHVLNYQFFNKDPNTTKRNETRLATMKELEAYQRYINQSSPIEHK